MSAQPIDAQLAILNAPWPSADQVREQEGRKAFATLQARAALRGIVLVETHDDRGRAEWIASLHAMCKSFSSLDDLGAWLDRVEGRRA